MWDLVIDKEFLNKACGAVREIVEEIIVKTRVTLDDKVSAETLEIER